MWLSVQKRMLASWIVVWFAIASVGCSQTAPYVGEPAGSEIQVVGREDQVKQRVLLVGDAGEPETGDCGGRESCEPVLDVLQHWASKGAGGRKPFTVFLGDNIYPRGLPDETKAGRRLRAEAKLNAQTAVLVNSGTRGTFIPGNHDWGGTFGGYHENWIRQDAFLRQAASRQQEEYGQSHLLVPDVEPGCPWPASIDESELEGVTLIILDSQWWLTPDDVKEVDSCARTSAESIAEAEARVVTELTEMLEAAGENVVIVATHHPMATHGVHGAWFRYFAQDIRSSKYQNMVRAIEKAYHDSGVRPLIHAAGHDHSLQVLRGAGETGKGRVSAEYNLVSGAGSEAKLQPVRYGDDTMYAHENTGFMVVDVMQSGEVFLQVIETDDSVPMNPNGERTYVTQLK